MFSVISSAVNKAFSGRALSWATVGGGLALRQVYGAVRASMGAFDQICRELPARAFTVASGFEPAHVLKRCSEQEHFDRDLLSEIGV